MATRRNTTVPTQSMFDFDVAPPMRDLPPLVFIDAPVLPPVDTKRCKTCGERKPLYEFTSMKLGGRDATHAARCA